VSDHFVLIPPEGLLHVFHSERALDIEATLAANGGDGRFTTLTIETDGDYVGQVHWLISPTTPVNPRARIALSVLGDIHLIFTGPVMFSNLEERKAGEIVTELSLRGG
jgi:hypothetical protein